MKSSAVYAILSYVAYLMLFSFGIARGEIYVDPVLLSATFLGIPEMYLPPIIIGALIAATVLLHSYREVEIYLTGVLIIIYGFFFIATIPYTTLLPYGAISLVTILAYFATTVGFNRRTSSKLGAFMTVIVAMFAIGSALRFDAGPPAYAMAFGSIYDDIQPSGVPLMFTDGIIFYARYFIISVSVPVVVLFTVLSVVLTENYYLIFKLLRFQGGSNIRKTASNAVTVLSCQCEGITASFPSAIATILLTAIVPLISESIVFIFMTDLLLVMFYLKGRPVHLLDRIWGVTNSRGFFLGMLISLIAIPVYSLFVVYLSLQTNLLVFSSVNVLMFVYGIFVSYLIVKVIPMKRRLSMPITVLFVILSSVMMFIWYFPQLTLPTVTSADVFAVMSAVSVGSGILSGIVFKGCGEVSKRLYFEFITMMFSMLAIITFYITAIGLRVLWPEFGIAQQLQFSLLLWGFTLPVMWLSTNISLNADSAMRRRVPFEFLGRSSRQETKEKVASEDA